MKWMRWALVLAAFQMEVRVKAHPESLSWPEGCLTGTGECSVKTGTATLELKSGKGRLTFAAGALVDRKGSAWKLMRGIARATNADLVSVYGTLSPSEEAWLVDEGRDRLTVRAVEGAARFVLRDGRELEIPEGFEVWVGPLNADARNIHGVPAPIPVEDHLKKISTMDRPSEEQLRARVKALKTRWKDRHETASVLYDDISKRRLASVEEEARKEKARRDAIEEGKRRNRQMLYDRAFGR